MVEMVFDDVLAAAGDEDELLDARLACASSTAYWTTGLSTTGSISFGTALVAGRKRVPMPATGKTALRTGGGVDICQPMGQSLGNIARPASIHESAADGPL